MPRSGVRAVAPVVIRGSNPKIIVGYSDPRGGLPKCGYRGESD